MSAALAIAWLAFAAPEPTGDEACAWIQLTDDPSISVEELIYAADSAGVARILARVIDRLESRGCLARSTELLTSSNSFCSSARCRRSLVL